MLLFHLESEVDRIVENPENDKSDGILKDIESAENEMDNIKRQLELL